MISLGRLREGGAAILAARNRNHIIVIGGAKVSSPLVMNILRVEVCS